MGAEFMPWLLSVVALFVFFALLSKVFGFLIRVAAFFVLVTVLITLIRMNAPTLCANLQASRLPYVDAICK